MSLKHFESREGWLDFRQHFVGASESPAILGLGYKGQNAHTVWEAKVNPQPEEDRDERLVVGSMLEPAILELYTYKTGVSVQRESNVVRLHPDHTFVGASLDAEPFEHPDHGLCVLDAKNVDALHGANWREGEIPLRVQIQLQQQMACVPGATYGFAVALVGGNKPVVLGIERDDRFIAALLAKLCRFWEFVVSKELPPIGHAYETAQVLQRLHPDDNGVAVKLPQEAEATLAMVRCAEAHMKVCERVKTQGNNTIKAMLGANTYGVLPSGAIVSWKTSERKGYQVAPTKTRTLRKLKRLPKNVPVTEYAGDIPETLPLEVKHGVEKESE